MNQIAQQTEQVPILAVQFRINDRRTFRDIDTLAANIRQNGLICPPVYRRCADGALVCIAGERRTRAYLLNYEAGLTEYATIPAYVVDVDDRTALAMMGAENRCRDGLNPLDEAQGYARFMADYSADAGETGAAMGVSGQIVKDRVALLTLNADAQDLIARGTLKPEYGLILAKAELPAMYQNRALDLLRDNPSPNLVWWRATVSEIKGYAAQPDLFAWGDYTEAKKADLVEALPLPWTHSAPSVPGEDARTTLVRQITFWTRASEQWHARGKKQHMQACGGAAWQLNAVLQRMDAGTLGTLASY